MRLVSEENWGSRREVTLTNTDTKEVKKVTAGGRGEEERKGAWTVLDVSHDLIVAQFSTPNLPPQLVRQIIYCRLRIIKKPSFFLSF